MTVDWSEVHPPVEVVAEELRRLRFEKTMAEHRTRHDFLEELKQTVNETRQFRDTRPQTKRKYVRKVPRPTSLVEFEQRQTQLAERILNDLMESEARSRG